MATRLSEFATLVHAQLADASVKKFDDIVALQKHTERRRVVWITPGGTTEPPPQAGGRSPADGTSFRVQACRTRVENVDVHIFAESRELTERLLDNLIAAICLVAKVVAIPTYRWETEERDQSGKVLRAHECVLRINLRFAVPDEVKPLTPVTAQEHLCGTLQEDGSITPQGDTPEEDP